MPRTGINKTIELVEPNGREKYLAHSMADITILTCIHYYVPGYKAGGPIQSLANLVERLGDEFQFKIVTTDRDYEDRTPYEGIVQDSWNRVGKADVYYCSPQNQSLASLRRIIDTTPHHILYLNSFFQPTFTIKPLILRRLGLIPARPLVIAPRGEFGRGALSLKRRKKRLYIFISKMLGFCSGLAWHASSTLEEKEIRQCFGDEVRVLVAPNIPPSTWGSEIGAVRSEKTSGRLRAFYLSRVTPKKNLEWALEVIRKVRGQVEYNIYGPIEDEIFWAKCQRVIATLPSNIAVCYRGAVPRENVAAIMSEHDLFFLPTRGENFGHAILEAFLSGCPVLISDQTPWRNLEDSGVGWDLSLDEPEQFRRVLQQCVKMDSVTHKQWSQRALAYGLMCSQNEQTVKKSRELFHHALQ